MTSMKLWEKSTQMTAEIERFTVGRDREMDLYLAQDDVLGSMAHITKLESIGLLEKDELDALLAELRNIYGVAERGEFVIEDDVEIGANSCIDRATMGSTRIKKGCKIDNLCQLAHNVVLGEDTAMASQSAVAGSGKVGSHCIIAGQVGIVGHIEVGDNVTIGAQSGVTRSIKSGMTVLGTPAGDASKVKKVWVHERNLDALVKRIDELEKKLGL